MNEVALPAHMNLPAGGTPKAIVPQDFDGAWRIAQAVTKAGMAPQGLDKPERALIAILHGLEVGFTPMAALQSIAVINGRPSIWGDGALALVQSSGKMQAFKERREGEGDNMIAYCEARRVGMPDLIVGQFSVADAMKAKLWGKSGPWTQYPERMLQMRARAFALRDGFADVLRGLGIAEEVSDVVAVQAPEPPVPPSPQAEKSTEAAQDADIIEAEVITPDEGDTATDAQSEPDDMAFDADKFLDRLHQALEAASTREEVDECWESMDVEARLTHSSEKFAIAVALRDARYGMLK